MKRESEKVGIKPELKIYRSEIMKKIRYGRVIYGLLMLNKGEIETGIKFIEKFSYLDNLPIRIDSENKKLIIDDEGIIREYDFNEVIFVEDFLF